MKLKDVYDSVKKGKEIKRLKERGEFYSKENPIQLNEEPLNEDNDLLTENIITRWIDKFFEKVKARQSQEMIKDIYFKDPELGKEMEKIRISMNKINVQLAKKSKYSKKELEKILSL